MANWRITDGTLAAGPAAGFVHRWRIGTRLTTLRAGFGRDGSYCPVSGLALVFAGDTFDWLVSSEWLGETRPWHGGRRAADLLERVAERSFRRGRRLLATLVSWSRRGVEVPEADRHGRPSMNATRRVPVRVALLGGDRDEQLEQVVGRRAPAWGLGIGRVWSKEDVSIRHGHEYDPLCDTALGRPTLAESLAVDLIARFGAEAAGSAGIGSTAPSLVRSLSGGSPATAADRLADWLHGASGGGVTERRSLIDAWNRRVAAWHRVARRLPPRGAGGVDVVDWLAASLELNCGGRTRPVFGPGRSGRAGSAGASRAAVIVGHTARGDEIFGAASPSGSCRFGGLPTGLGTDDDHDPASAVVRFGSEGVVLDAVQLGLKVWPDPGAGGDEDRGVWISGPPVGRRGIVDAA